MQISHLKIKHKAMNAPNECPIGCIPIASPHVQVITSPCTLHILGWVL